MILLRSYVGAELRQLRLSKKMSLRDVASSANISLGYVSEVERGLKEASSEILFAMCRALEVPMSSVLLEVSSKLMVQELELLLETSHLETI